MASNDTDENNDNPKSYEAMLNAIVTSDDTYPSEYGVLLSTIQRVEESAVMLNIRIWIIIVFVHIRKH